MTEAAGRTGSRAVRNTTILLAARVASRLIALVTVLATGNALGDTRFGQFQTAVTWVSLVSVLLDLGFNNLYVREAAREPSQLARYLRMVLSTRALFAGVALVVLAGVLSLQGLGGLLVPAFLVMLTAGYGNVLRSTFYATGRLGPEAIATVGEAALLLALTLLGVRTHQGVAYFLWAYTAIYTASIAFFSVVLAARRTIGLGIGFEWPLFRRWLTLALPFALTFVITTIYFKIDVPILYQFKGPTEVGWYTFAYKPIEALLFIPITILNVIFPLLGRYHHLHERERYARTVNLLYKTLLALGWPISVGTVLLAPGLTRLFHLYPQSEVALQILGFGVVLMFVTNAFSGALNASDQQRLYTYAALVSLVVNVGLNLVVIPRYGYQGASWATNLTEVALLGVTFWLARRTGTKVPVLRLSWRIVLAGLLMGLAVVWFRPLAPIQTLIAIPVGLAVYAAAALLLHAFDREELGIALRSLRPAG